MFRITSAKATVCTLALGIGACSFAPLIEEHVVEYNKTIADARNRLLFLNIIRARERLPMAFSTLSGLNARATSTSSLGITVFQGPGANTNSPRPINPSVNLDTGATYDVEPRYSKEFMQGFRTPITMKTFDHYWQEEWPKDLLLNLFVQKIEATVVTGFGNSQKPAAIDKSVLFGSDIGGCLKGATTGLRASLKPEDMQGVPIDYIILYNQPGREKKRWAKYQSFKCLLDAIRPKLRIALESKESPSKRDVYATGALLLRDLISASKEKITVKQVHGTSRRNLTNITLHKNVSELLFCLDNSPKLSSSFPCKPDGKTGKLGSGGTDEKSINTEAGSVPLVGFLGIKTKGSDANGVKIMIAKSGKTVLKPTQELGLKLKFHLRSTEGILYYLGEVMRAYNNGSGNIVTISRDDIAGEIPLFTGKAGVATDARVGVAFEGTQYIIPRDNSRSMHALSLVTQLLALNLSSKDAPTTATVNVKN